MSNRRNTLLALGSGMTLLAGASFLGSSSASEKAVPLPAPTFNPPNAAGRDTAVIAGGCFWGVQAVFQHTRGVLNAVSGYSGGEPNKANYAAVSSGRSSHAEAVQVNFDPAQISYGRLLQIFFSVAHDPTQLNRQGPDSGPQYRSALFCQGQSQKQIAQRYIEQLDAARLFPAKIVTQVVDLQAFHPAEDYHQDYATRNPRSPYIMRFDAPKIQNLQRLFAPVYRDKPVLVASQRGA